jgi:hypothetical protein
MNHINAQAIADRSYLRLKEVGELAEFCEIVKRSELDTHNNLLDEASMLILQRFEAISGRSVETTSSHQGAMSHLP